MEEFSGSYMYLEPIITNQKAYTFLTIVQRSCSGRSHLWAVCLNHANLFELNTFTVCGKVVTSLKSVHVLQSRCSTYLTRVTLWKVMKRGKRRGRWETDIVFYTTHNGKGLEWVTVQICCEKSQECRAKEEEELIYLSMVHMVDPILQSFQLLV